MKKTQKRVKNLIAEIADNYPAAAIALNNMDFRPTNMIPTAACDYRGNGIYNPEFFDSLSDMNIKAVLLHEALHLYFNHFKRFTNVEKLDSYDDVMKNPAKYSSKLQAWNIAADSFINEVIIKELPANSLPNDCVTFTEIKKMTGIDRSTLEKSCTEEIYKILCENHDNMMEEIKKMIENMASQDQSSQISGDTQGSSQSNSNGSQNSPQDKNNNNEDNEDDTDNGEGGNESENKIPSSIVVVVDQEIQDIIDEVYGNDKNDGDQSAEPNSTDNTGSQLSSDINSMRAGNSRNKSEIEIIKDVVSITNVEWKEILSEFVYNISGKATSGRTWQRPSRRYRDVYPISQGRKRKAKTKDFTFAIDVSGSMNKDKIRRAFDIVLDYAKENDMACKYYFWSTDKSEIYDFIDEKDFAKNLQKHYGGGTNLDCALNNYDSVGVGEGLIVVTDLEFDRITEVDLDKFDGPLVFLDIEPNQDTMYNNTKNEYISVIEKTGNKYAKFY